MAYDIKSAADKAALKAEVNNDPLGLGYNAPSGDINLVLDTLNQPAKNTGAETGFDFVTVKRLLDVIMPEAISAQDQFKIQLIFEGAAGFETDVSDYKAAISLLSAGLAAGLDTIIRDLSRAEVLFSDIDANGITEREVISKAEWVAARDS